MLFKVVNDSVACTASLIVTPMRLSCEAAHRSLSWNGLLLELKELNVAVDGPAHLVAVLLGVGRGVGIAANWVNGRPEQMLYHS